MVKKQSGQVILALILIMTVALAIGLSIVQKSLVDVSTSTKVEQSSRAFSAAEAGIEKALKGDTQIEDFGNNASIKEINDSKPAPCVPGSSGCAQVAGEAQAALEYPPISKEDVAQVWLADLNSDTNPPAYFYIPPSNTLDVFWGNSQTDKTALELTLVYFDGIQYKNGRKWYLDDSSAVRNPANNFDPVPCSANHSIGNNTYQCYIRLGDGSINASKNGSLPTGLMLLRARLLYNTTSQPFAVQAVGNCGQNCSIPPQARVLTSIGASGETQRKVKVFQINKVVPPYFDYAIFSAGAISK